MPNKRRSKEETKEIDATAERLRDFLRLNYISYAETARESVCTDRNLYTCGKNSVSRAGSNTRLSQQSTNSTGLFIAGSGNRFKLLNLLAYYVNDSNDNGLNMRVVKNRPRP